MEKREFKGIWIPKEIWLSPKLTIQEKVFLVEIDSLDSSDKGCYAGNRYFAKFFGLSEDRCSEIISALKKKLMIDVSVDKGSGKSIRKITSLMILTTRRKGGVGIGENTEWPLGENTAPSNTEENNTVNNPTGGGGREIGEVIFLFKAVNPMIQKLYGSPPQRKSVERMLKEMGREKLEAMIQALPQINAQQYWPKSTTPVQLENNIGVYMAKKSELETPQRSANTKVAIIR